jgi:hypothetical protein
MFNAQAGYWYKSIHTEAQIFKLYFLMWAVDFLNLLIIKEVFFMSANYDQIKEVAAFYGAKGGYSVSLHRVIHSYGG